MSFLGVLVVLALIAAFAGGKHLWAVSAPPLSRAVDFVEKDPDVTAALGSPGKVSLGVSRTLRRDPLQAIRGNDNVFVLSTVEGAKGEATFRLSAQNVNGQGWAGTFSVELAGRQVLKDGGYVQEGARTLVAGDFAPDGTPRVKKP